MSAVYQINENLLACFTKGKNYYGFLNDSEQELDQAPVDVLGNVLTPGDRIKGFDSGTARTSFLLDYDYMTYRGAMGIILMFDVYDSKTEQPNPGGELPLWLLAFPWFEERQRMHMFPRPEASWDILPLKIIRA